jgi:predicted RNA-binding Zn-ribbon protein involved in translation (DUF1610 family)
MTAGFTSRMNVGNERTEEVTMNCPQCNGQCWRDEVDIGVGVQYGPWNCEECGWYEGRKTRRYRMRTQARKGDAMSQEGVDKFVYVLNVMQSARNELLSLNPKKKRAVKSAQQDVRLAELLREMDASITEKFIAAMDMYPYLRKPIK